MPSGRVFSRTTVIESMRTARSKEACLRFTETCVRIAESLTVRGSFRGRRAGLGVRVDVIGYRLSTLCRFAFGACDRVAGVAGRSDTRVAVQGQKYRWMRAGNQAVLGYSN